MIGWLIIALAHTYAGPKPISSADIVTVNVSESIVYAGERNSVEIRVTVKEGYHIQANKVNDESLIPTTLEIESNEFLFIGSREFPPSKQFKLEGADGFLNVFDGSFLIKLFLDPAKYAEEGKYVLEASLRYQACDSRSCLFPKTINFLIPVEIKIKK